MSEAILQPGAILEPKAINRFKGSEIVNFPLAGEKLCHASGGCCVLSKDNVVVIATFVPEHWGPVPTALMSGMTAKEAHEFGSSLIAAAQKVGGDRGLQ